MSGVWSSNFPSFFLCGIKAVTKCRVTNVLGESPRIKSSSLPLLSLLLPFLCGRNVSRLLRAFSLSLLVAVPSHAQFTLFKRKVSRPLLAADRTLNAAQGRGSQKGINVKSLTPFWREIQTRHEKSCLAVIRESSFPSSFFFLFDRRSCGNLFVFCCLENGKTAKVC